jgi:hypothetical protein
MEGRMFGFEGEDRPLDRFGECPVTLDLRWAEEAGHPLALEAGGLVIERALGSGVSRARSAGECTKRAAISRYEQETRPHIMSN